MSVPTQSGKVRSAFAVAVTASALAVCRADVSTTRPAADVAARKECADQTKVLRGLWQRAADAMGGSGNVPAALADPSKRQAAAAKAIPILRDELTVIDRIAATNVSAAYDVADMRQESEGLLFLLGDPATTARVARMQKSGVAVERFDGLCVDLWSQWLATGWVAERQEKVADRAAALDAANPAEPRLVVLTLAMADGTDSAALNRRLTGLISGTLTSPEAKAAALRIADRDRKIAAMRKAAAAATVRREALVGKPFALAGRTPDGKDFTSADWKGRVVLIDFWATWCGPCVAGLPEIKDQYTKDHDRGFEVVGVSGDWDAKVLTDFAARHELPWPQLFDPTLREGDDGAELSRRYDVTGLPTLFLVDRKGILRSVGGWAKLKELIPKLLAE